MVSDLKTFTNKGCKIAALKRSLFLVWVFLTPFYCLVAPTSRSLKSKLFRFSQFLGKSNGKKQSQIKKKLLLMWHATHKERWKFSPNFRSLAHMVCEWRCLEDLEEKYHLINEWITKVFVVQPSYTGSVNYLRAYISKYNLCFLLKVCFLCEWVFRE